MNSVDKQIPTSSGSPSNRFRPTHQRKTSSNSSSEFGSFNSARPPLSPPRSRPSAAGSIPPYSLLDDDDFLGSPSYTASSRTSRQEPPGAPAVIGDLLGGETWTDATTPRVGTPSTPNRATSSHAATHGQPINAIHVTLPPRPTEIPADFIPPMRSPRRMSSHLFSPGLGSPPIVSDAGGDIIFHPTHPVKEDAASEMRRVQHANPSASPVAGSSEPSNESFLARTLSRSPPHHSRLLDTLATTTKLASKWRSALTNSTFTPAETDRTGSTHRDQTITKTPEPVPIDINHNTPFATAEQISGSYTAPTGAPGFDSHARSSTSSRASQHEDWGHITLLGRRDTTSPVLSVADADQLRQHVPPRQRLSSSWTLLFSLDQHGASLSTLYRLVEKYGQTHRTSGNILVVCDGEGNRFGVYLNESIVKREGTYYGSGESFLFKLFPTSHVKTFRWSGRNQYFALCENGFISFGGGAGTYGLLLDSTFTHNSSATCPAYNNEILSTSASVMSSQAATFSCIGLEVWGT
ncbi:hypothetical protein IAT40_000428 [Kwoniella sp. CBS 6097]